MSDYISRQAATKTALDFIVEYLGGAFDEDFQKKLIKQMNALPSVQSEPCEDAVSRAFMYELGATCIAKPDGNGNLIALGRIDMLPPVTPKPKTGKWVNNLHDLPICDQCGYMTPYDRAIDDYEYGNYCPNCGAKMNGGEQDDT